MIHISAKANTTPIPAADRNTYLDNLKLCLTFLVIAHHASQAYGPTGGAWVYMDPGNSVMWLRSFMAVNASFFMGFFFLISGYFIPRSFDGRTAGAFFRQKAKRLLLPVLFILAAVVPAYFYIAMTYRGANTYDFFTFYAKSYIGDGLLSYEHGWYMVHLFLYSLAYALVRLLLRNRKISTGKAPNILLILGLGALIAVLSLVVRIYYPVDKWVDVLGVIGVEPAHLPQYALLFAFGVVAYRKGYFTSLSKRTGLLSLVAGLAMALVIYMGKLPVLVKIMPIVWDIWPIYESFMCVFLCFGLLVFFRTYCSRTNFILRKLAENAFGAYVIHNFFVVLFQVSFDKVRAGGNVKFASVSFLAILCSFGLSMLYTEAKRAIKKGKNKEERKQLAG